MNGSCLVVSGGEFSELPENMENTDYVIACDMGWEHAKRLGLTPDLTVGDFDSSILPPADMPVLNWIILPKYV